MAARNCGVATMIVTRLDVISDNFTIFDWHGGAVSVLNYVDSARIPSLINPNERPPFFEGEIAGIASLFYPRIISLWKLNIFVSSFFI